MTSRPRWRSSWRTTNWSAIESCRCWRTNTKSRGWTNIIASGKELHRTWCARVFQPSLVSLSAAERRRRLAQFVAVCDVYTWKLLRRDAGLSRRQTELALVELLTPMMEES